MTARPMLLKVDDLEAGFRCGTSPPAPAPRTHCDSGRSALRRYFISYLKKPDNDVRWHDGYVERDSPL